MKLLAKSFLYILLLPFACTNSQATNENYTNSQTIQLTKRNTMKHIDDDIREIINRLVKSGFYDKNRLFTIFHEEIYAPNELDPNQLRQVIDELVQQHQRDKATWEHVTDNDKLTSAFKELNQLGIIALENAGYTQSDGYDDVLSIVKRSSNPSKYLGYCFYHSQDMDRGIQGLGLYLGFGSIDPQKEETVGIEVGQKIVETLHKHGLKTQWNGTFNQRIQIVNFTWQRR